MSGVMEEPSAFISITRLRVRAWRYTFGFFVRVILAALQARSAQGCAAIVLLRDARRTYWTCTIWIDESSMRSFMISGAHRTAMPRLLDWCDEASVVHWLQESAQLPSWSEIHRRMQEEGRRSNVRHPSADHLAYRIAIPLVGRSRILPFKLGPKKSALHTTH